MKNKLGTIAVAILVVFAIFQIALEASAAPTVPAGFNVTLLASGLISPKGIVSALHRAGAGQFGHDLYVAESGAGNITDVGKGGAGASAFATTGFFPVGVAFSGGPFGEFLYVGRAFGGGIARVDPSGSVTPFALAGMSISGLDFGRGAYGNDMYAGEWPMGKIHRVDPNGTATLFANMSGNETRYLKFSHGNAFGTFLYYTDLLSGKIYKVDPSGNAAVFANIGSPCLEGFDVSSGGAFGHYLYAGDVCNGNIYRVAPDGTVMTWATGFGGVADIHFEPLAMGQAKKGGGFIMYIADATAGKIYGISKD